MLDRCRKGSEGKGMPLALAAASVRVLRYLRNCMAYSYLTLITRIFIVNTYTIDQAQHFTVLANLTFKLHCLQFMSWRKWFRKVWRLPRSEIESALLARIA